MQIQQLIPYLSTLSPVVTIIVGYRNTKSPLWLYAIAGFLSNLLMVVVFKGQPIRGLIANTFIIAEFFLIYRYYSTILELPFRRILIAAYFIAMPALLNTFYIQEKGFSFSQVQTAFNWLGASALAMLYIGFSLAGFLQIIRKQSVTHLERSAFFLVNTAFIIYYSTVFLVLLFSQYLIDASKISLFWNFLEIMNIVKYLIIAFALTVKNP